MIMFYLLTAVAAFQPVPVRQKRQEQIKAEGDRERGGRKVDIKDKKPHRSGSLDSYR